MKLSIITINYNHRDGLQRTIDSIIPQTFKDYEWIVIDGGSDDGSRDLIEKYQEHFAYWCSEKDNGIYNAMNKGILHANGEYLNFMNSGDIFASSTILQEIFSKPHEADILYGYMMCGSIDGRVGNIQMMKSHLNYYGFYCYTLAHQSTFTKRKLFMSLGLFDESYRLLADRKFFAVALNKKKASYEFIPKKISIYEGGGLSDREDTSQELKRLRYEIYGDVFLNDLERRFTYAYLVDEFAWSRALYSLLVHVANWCYRHFRLVSETYDSEVY